MAILQLFYHQPQLALSIDPWVVFFAVDIISAIEFDKSGDHLATGDRGGRVVLFERNDTRDVCVLSVILLCI